MKSLVLATLLLLFSNFTMAAEQTERSTANINIPDLGSASSGIGFNPNNFPSGANITSVDVFYAIVHTYSGDLIVKIEHPDGTEHILRNREGGSADNPSGTVNGISIFNGKSPGGLWHLNVSDSARADTGYIDEVVVTIHYTTGSNDLPSVGHCVETISFNTNVSGSWESSCTSTHRSGRYAKYYTFSLSSSQEVTIDLQSSIDTYLYLLNGSGQNGSIITYNDDSNGTLNSQIIRTLPVGTYTVEATTYSPGRTGGFSILIGASNSTDNEQALYDINDFFTIETSWCDGPHIYMVIKSLVPINHPLYHELVIYPGSPSAGITAILPLPESHIDATIWSSNQFISVLNGLVPVWGSITNTITSWAEEISFIRQIEGIDVVTIPSRVVSSHPASAGQPLFGKRMYRITREEPYNSYPNQIIDVELRWYEYSDSEFSEHSRNYYVPAENWHLISRTYNVCQ